MVKYLLISSSEGKKTFHKITDADSFSYTFGDAGTYSCIYFEGNENISVIDVNVTSPTPVTPQYVYEVEPTIHTVDSLSHTVYSTVTFQKWLRGQSCEIPYYVTWDSGDEWIYATKHDNSVQINIDANYGPSRTGYVRLRLNEEGDTTKPRETSITIIQDGIESNKQFTVYYSSTSSASVGLVNADNLVGILYIDGVESGQVDNATRIVLESDKTYKVEFRTNDNTDVIPANAFSNNENVAKVVIEQNKISEVGQSAFDNCIGLQSINLDGIVTIDDMAFANCYWLKIVDGLEDAQTIGERAFMNCTELKTITIAPQTIGEGVFNGCLNLTRVVWTSSELTIIPNDAFANCTSLSYIGTDTLATSIDLPQSVEEIGEGAFEGCSSITSVAIPSATKLVDYDAFKDCTSLQYVAIGNIDTHDSQLELIGNQAFLNDDKIEWVKLGCTNPPIIKPYNHSTQDTSRVFSVSSYETGSYPIYIPNGYLLNYQDNIRGSWEYEDEGTQYVGLKWSTNYAEYIGEDNKNWEPCAKNRVEIVSQPYTYDLAADRSRQIPLTYGDLSFNVDITKTDGLIPYDHNLWESILDDPDGVTPKIEHSFMNGVEIWPSHAVDDRTPYTRENFGIDIAFKTLQEGEEIILPNLFKQVGNTRISGNITSVAMRGPNVKVEYPYFIGFSNMESVDLTKCPHITEISELFFDGCEKLTFFDTGPYVTRIGEDAFTGCSSLSKLVVRENCTQIDGEIVCGNPFQQGYFDMIYIESKLTSWPFGEGQEVSTDKIRILLKYSIGHELMGYYENLLTSLNINFNNFIWEIADYDGR